MATTVISSSNKPHKWFSPKTYFKSRPKKSASVSTAKARTRIIEEYRIVFSHLDSDGDGKISGDELRSHFASVGESVSRDEARSAVGESLDFEGFVRLIERSDEKEMRDDLTMAFEMFESEKGSGFINPRGLQKMLSRLGDSRSLRDCESMIRAFDLDGNGVNDFHEFVLMMTSN